MPIVGGDVNHVYIRGHGSGGPYVASLRAFPSELILWPHVWSNVEPVSSGPVAISCGDTPGRCRYLEPFRVGLLYIWIVDASEDPLWFRPPHDAGNACSLVAHVFKLDPANAHGDLKDFEPLPSFDAQTFDADDLFSFLSKNDGLTFYNVNFHIFFPDGNVNTEPTVYLGDCRRPYVEARCGPHSTPHVQ